MRNTVALRVVFAVLLVHGVVTAWCSQLGDTTHRFAIHRISQATERNRENRNAEHPGMDEVETALEAGVRMWNVTLFAGMGTVFIAGLGWLLVGKSGASRPPGNRAEHRPV